MTLECWNARNLEEWGIQGVCKVKVWPPRSQKPKVSKALNWRQLEEGSGFKICRVQDLDLFLIRRPQHLNLKCQSCSIFVGSVGLCGIRKYEALEHAFGRPKDTPNFFKPATIRQGATCLESHALHLHPSATRSRRLRASPARMFMRSDKVTAFRI